jgi:hypothetical protein
MFALIDAPLARFRHDWIVRSTLFEGGKTMKLRMMITMALAVFSLALVPALGVADGPDYHPETPQGPKYENPPQGPKTAPKGKAYGYYCRGQSKKHVKGEKGTAFSRCVKALAQADKNDNLNAKKACRSLSKKHVKGVKGTPFSKCVKGVNQMRQEAAASVASSSTA